MGQSSQHDSYLKNLRGWNQKILYWKSIMAWFLGRKYSSESNQASKI